MSLRKSKSKVQTQSSEISKRHDYLMKLMRGRKLHIPCPKCKTVVLNLSDHLTKSHSIKSVEERRNLMESLKDKLILSKDGLNELLEHNKSLSFLFAEKKGKISKQKLQKCDSQEVLVKKKIDFVENNFGSCLDRLRSLRFARKSTSPMQLKRTRKVRRDTGSREMEEKLNILEIRIENSIKALDFLKVNFMEKFNQLNQELRSAAEDLKSIKSDLNDSDSCLSD